MGVRGTIHYYTRTFGNPDMSPEVFELMASRAAGQFEYFGFNWHFDIRVKGWVYYYGRRVSGVYSGGDVWISAYNNQSPRTFCLLIMHEMMHRRRLGHHTRSGIMGSSGGGLVTWTQADLDFLRLNPALKPWDDPRNYPRTVEDHVIVEPGSRTEIDVLANDVDPRGWEPLVLRSHPVASRGTARRAYVGGKWICVFFSPQEPGPVEIEYEVQSQASAIRKGKLTVQVESPQQDWQNPENQYDVDGSGQVTARDALLVINRVGDPVDRSRVATDSSGNRIYPDVTGDDRISSLDAIQVINHIGE